MSLKLVVLLAFIGSLALTMLLLSCTLKFGDDPTTDDPKDDQNNCYTLFVLIFYVLAPVPILIARKISDELVGTCLELASFVSTGFVLSAFALPIVLANREVIQWGSCGLAMAGNVVMFATIVGGFRFFGADTDFGYSSFSL